MIPIAPCAANFASPLSLQNLHQFQRIALTPCKFCPEVRIRGDIFHLLAGNGNEDFHSAYNDPSKKGRGIDKPGNAVIFVKCALSFLKIRFRGVGGLLEGIEVVPENFHETFHFRHHTQT